MIESEFDYKEAFCRNIGLLTEEEQEKLKRFKIAIPGMGGVGGANLISLVRQGFERFNISDFDCFELKNFNRQYGSDMTTIGKEKVEVMKQKALGINPNCRIEIFPDGINGRHFYNYMFNSDYSMLENYLKGVDLVIDSLDFHAVEARRLLYNKSLEKGIPVINSGPIGFSSAYVIFMPGGPNFDEYYDVTEATEHNHMLLSFALGTAPALLQRKYMYNPRLFFETLVKRKCSSSVGSIDLCAGVNTITAMKILLKKGKVYPVPYYHQFDVMTNKYVCRKRRFRLFDNIIIEKVLKQAFVDELYKVHSDPELYKKYFKNEDYGYKPGNRDPHAQMMLFK